MHAQVFHGMVSAAPDRFDLRASTPGGGGRDAPSYLLALWQHECHRVFCDKLVCEADRDWVQQELQTLVGYEPFLCCLRVAFTCPLVSHACFTTTTLRTRLCIDCTRRLPVRSGRTSPHHWWSSCRHQSRLRAT